MVAEFTALSSVKLYFIDTGQRLPAVEYSQMCLVDVEAVGPGRTGLQSVLNNN